MWRNAAERDGQMLQSGRKEGGRWLHQSSGIPLFRFFKQNDLKRS